MQRGRETFGSTATLRYHPHRQRYRYDDRDCRPRVRLDRGRADSFDQFPLHVSADSSYNDAAERDIVENFEANGDTFVFDGIAGFDSDIDYIDTAAFSGGGDNSEARLTDLGGDSRSIEIDVDGDGASVRTT